MINNPYDHALKLLARTYPEAFLHLAFPNQPMQLLGTTANVELALEIDRVDFLHEMEIAGVRTFFHCDFQLEHSSDCPRRFFVYNAMLSELNKPTPVITLPIYLRPREAPLPSQYEVKVGDTVFHQFNYHPVKLWEYVDQIRSGQLYVFAPLLPLLVRPMSEALLMEERQLILTYESDQRRQRTLLTTAILIAAQSELFTSDFLWSLFVEDDMDTENPVIAKLLERAYREKMAAERKELEEQMERRLQHEKALADRRVAEVEAARYEAETQADRQWQELTLKVLEHRFQSVPVALVLLLASVEANQRSRVSDIILEAGDINTCLQQLRQLLDEKP